MKSVIEQLNPLLLDNTPPLFVFLVSCTSVYLNKFKPNNTHEKNK